MRRIRVLTDISFAEGRGQAGDVLSLPDDLALSLVGLGLAESAEPPTPEISEELEAAALADAPERAVVPRAKKRG
jgi:hypothetical protein